MTLAADRFLCLDVAGPTSRVVSLPPSGVDLKNVRPRLVSRHFNRLMTFIAGGLFEMRPVSEVIKTKRRPERLAVLHRIRLAYVTGSAGGELIVGLMVVTGVALGVLGHTGLQAWLIKMMAEVTFGCALGHLVGFHLPFHLLRVCVSAMRETLEPELYKLRRERDPRALCVNRDLMADDAQLALHIGPIFVVTVPAG